MGLRIRGWPLGFQLEVEKLGIEIKSAHELYRNAARLLIWSFFLLIFSRVLEFFAFSYESPVRPVAVYAAIAGGFLLLSVKRIQIDPFLCLLGIIVAIGFWQYRGEGVVEFPSELLSDVQPRPSHISYAVWPLLNLVAAVGLFSLVNEEDFQKTVRDAAFATLCLLMASMIVDFFWPHIFHDIPNGRASGLAKNPNTAAMMAATLAALMLPRTGERLPYQTWISIGIAVLAAIMSGSRSGQLAVGVVAATGLWTHCQYHPSRRAIIGWGAVLCGLCIAIVYFQMVRIDSSNLRLHAAGIFLDAALGNPSGFGTGATNDYVTGPHNTFLKLMVESGVVSAVLMLLLMGYISYSAYSSRSPRSVAVVSVAWIAVLFSHTALVEPLAMAAVAITAVKGVALVSLRRDEISANP